MIYERISFLSDDVEIKGKYFHPRSGVCVQGIVIFTHGLGYCDRQYDLDPKVFLEEGLAFVTYNLRGHANTKGEWTFDAAVSDLVNLVSHLQQAYGNLPIFLIGHSTGALISIFASICDEKVKGVSAVTLVTSLRDSFKHWFHSGYNIEVKEYFKTKGEIPQAINDFMDDINNLYLYTKGALSDAYLNVPHRYGMLKSRSWNEFFNEVANSIDINQHLDKLRAPIYMFWGSKDEVMDINKILSFYQNAQSYTTVNKTVTKSTNHFHNGYWDEILIISCRFFKQISNSHTNAAQHKKKVTAKPRTLPLQ